RFGARKPHETRCTICFLVLGMHFKPLFSTISHRQNTWGYLARQEQNPKDVGRMGRRSSVIAARGGRCRVDQVQVLKYPPARSFVEPSQRAGDLCQLGPERWDQTGVGGIRKASAQRLQGLAHGPCVQPTVPQRDGGAVDIRSGEFSESGLQLESIRALDDSDS